MTFKELVKIMVQADLEEARTEKAYREARAAGNEPAGKTDAP